MQGEGSGKQLLAGIVLGLLVVAALAVGLRAGRRPEGAPTPPPPPSSSGRDAWRPSVRDHVPVPALDMPRPKFRLSADAGTPSP